MPIIPWGAKPGTTGGGSGTVTSVSVTTANGISGSVATATTTPAITLSLAAITPTTVNNVTISGSSTPALAITGTSSISGSNTGDQTITLTSDVTGSGTGSFATTIKSSVALSGSPTTTTQTPADNSTKIATTAYVDNAVLGQNFKEAVGATTTANLIGVYLNGSSGVGATFTYTATGVDTIDGVSLTLGMRVLLKNQTTAFQNGLYVVTTAGSIGIAGILTRTTDGDQSTDWKAGDSVFVTAGTTQSTTTWAYTGIDSPTMGSTSLTFAQTAGQGSFTAGNGIAITGNSIAIDTSVTVDISTTQTLTNKTLTTPLITGGLSSPSTPATGFGVLYGVGSSNISLRFKNDSGNEFNITGGLGAWTSYTPSWTNVTIGNAIVNANYTTIGKFTTVRISVVWGTGTSASGNIIFSLPVTAVAIGGTANVGFIGYGTMYDVSAGAVFSSNLTMPSTSTAQVVVLAANGTWLQPSNANSTTPAPWANTDEWNWTITYQSS